MSVWSGCEAKANLRVDAQHARRDCTAGLSMPLAVPHWSTLLLAAASSRQTFSSPALHCVSMRPRFTHGRLAVAASCFEKTAYCEAGGLAATSELQARVEGLSAQSAVSAFACVLCLPFRFICTLLAADFQHASVHIS